MWILVQKEKDLLKNNIFINKKNAFRIIQK